MAEENNSNAKEKAAKQTSGGILRALTESRPFHETNTDRVKVLVAIAELDSNINQLLIRKMVLSTHDDKDELLAEGAPLGSLMLRAKLARRLGLISGDLYGVIKLLSGIRNKCAHSEEKFDIFSDAEAKGHIDNMFSRINQGLLDKEAKYSTKDKFNLISGYCNSYIHLSLPAMQPISTPSKEVIFSQDK